MEWRRVCFWASRTPAGPELGDYCSVLRLLWPYCLRPAHLSLLRLRCLTQGSSRCPSADESRFDEGASEKEGGMGITKTSTDGGG